MDHTEEDYYEASKFSLRKMTLGAAPPLSRSPKRLKVAPFKARPPTSLAPPRACHGYQAPLTDTPARFPRAADDLPAATASRRTVAECDDDEQRGV